MPSPVIIPHLLVPLIQSGSCIAFDPGEGRILDWSRHNEGVFRALRDDGGEDKLWVDLAVDVSGKGRVHFHIERGRKEFSDVEADRCGFDDVVKKITDFVELVADRSFCIRTRAVLATRESEIPETGMICRLLRTEGSACGVPLSLTGGYIELGDDLYSKISFNKEKGSDVVFVAMNYQSEDCLGSDFLMEADALAITGAECFVFERVMPEVTHAYPR